MGLEKEAKEANYYLDGLIKILSEIDNPTVEDLKESRLGKILNKICKKNGN
jgi:hypothetical protein